MLCADDLIITSIPLWCKYLKYVDLSTELDLIF